jgi:hypothetical protein
LDNWDVIVDEPAQMNSSRYLGAILKKIREAYVEERREDARSREERQTIVVPLRGRGANLVGRANDGIATN